MEDFMPFDTEFDAEMSDTQLILHVDAQAEQNFLSRSMLKPHAKNRSVPLQISILPRT